MAVWIVTIAFALFVTYALIWYRIMHGVTVTLEAFSGAFSEILATFEKAVLERKEGEKDKG